MSRHADHGTANHATEMFEPSSWDERYSGDQDVWSGAPNAQLVAEAAALNPGSALDVGCGEGGDVIWLARHGWRVTGADFSKNGLTRAARHVERAGLSGQVDWWQVDARHFTAEGRAYELVSSHFLHPPEGGMLDVTRRLAKAVAPGGHLLIVGHAPPPESLEPGSDSRRKAMFVAEQLLPGLPADFEPLVVEQRPRTVTRSAETFVVHDSTLLARRQAETTRKAQDVRRT